jgi:hypothetical protein
MPLLIEMFAKTLGFFGVTKTALLTFTVNKAV